MAERAGFEPAARLLDVHTISNRAQSTTLTPLRVDGIIGFLRKCCQLWAISWPLSGWRNVVLGADGESAGSHIERGEVGHGHATEEHETVFRRGSGGFEVAVFVQGRLCSQL